MYREVFRILDIDVKAKCAGCAGAAGIAACTISMILSGAGIVAVGLSTASGGMQGMGGQTTGVLLGSSPLIQVIAVLSGICGEVILLGSFALMLFGMWSAKRTKPMILASVGAAILFVSMYGYFLIDLQVVGIAVLALAYATTYSPRAAAMVRMA